MTKLYGMAMKKLNLVFFFKKCEEKFRFFKL